MDDEELLICRYSSDKLEIIKEKIASFDDLEALLFDAELGEEEMMGLFHLLGDLELAA